MHLLDADGLPTAPTHVLARLAQIDEHLGLVWHPSGTSHTWAVVWTWRDADPRRAMIEAGEIAPHAAYDIVCFLPPDVSFDELPGWLRRAQKSTSREDIRRALDEVHRWNDGAADRAQSDDAFQDELEKSIMPEVLGRAAMGGAAASGALTPDSRTGPKPAPKRRSRKKKK